MTGARYYLVPTIDHPDPRCNWLVCDHYRLGGSEVARTDKKADAEHIVILLNASPDRPRPAAVDPSGPILQTYRRGEGASRSWVLLPSGHQSSNPEHNRRAALIVDELPAGSNHLINPRRLTFTVRAGASITLSVEQVRALLDEVGP